MLRLHCRYNAQCDALSELPPEIRHRELHDEEMECLIHQDPGRDDIKKHLALNYHEVVVIVEGIEPSTSSTLQAKYSYIVGGPSGGDVGWDMEFVECCREPCDVSKGLALDLSRFHDLEPVKAPDQV